MTEELEIMQELQHVGVLNLQPGDIVVLRTNTRIPWDAAERMREAAEKIFPGHECLVLQDVDIAVARREP